MCWFRSALNLIRMLALEEGPNISTAGGISKVAPHTPKQKEQLPHTDGRFCPNCWSLTPKSPGKLSPRSCPKCRTQLKVICAGCFSTVGIKNSERHLNLCEKYSELRAKNSGNFASNVKTILYNYLRRNSPKKNKVVKHRYLNIFICLFDFFFWVIDSVGDCCSAHIILILCLFLFFWCCVWAYLGERLM